MSKRKRRETQLKERVIPCQCCGYVISQRHHLLPVARYGENDVTVNLCANCHEAYHIFENGFLDFAANRYESHAMYLMGAIRWDWGGGDSPRVQFICNLLDRAREMQRAQAQDRQSPEDRAIRRELRALLDALDQRDGIPVKKPDVRRGDTVLLMNGKIVQVVSVADNQVHTTDGVYGLWQIEKVAKW